MTCPRCQQPMHYEVGNRLFGTCVQRCACGVQPIQPQPIDPVVPNSLAHLPDDDEGYGPSTGPATVVNHAGRDRKRGYTVGHGPSRWFYGTCRACGTEFECRHPRATCGKPECRKVLATASDPMIDATCPRCTAVYKTRKAKPRASCLPCHRKTYPSRRTA